MRYTKHTQRLLPESSSASAAVFSLDCFFSPLSASLCTWAFPAVAAWFLSDSVGKLADGISIPCSQTNLTAANYLWSPKHCLINSLGWCAGLPCQLTQGADDTRFLHLLYPLQAWGRQRRTQEESQVKLLCSSGARGWPVPDHGIAWAAWGFNCRLFKGVPHCISSALEEK